MDAQESGSTISAIRTSIVAICRLVWAAELKNLARQDGAKDVEYPACELHVQLVDVTSHHAS
eukprot:1141570-Pleurochrysis_carterae.AAC.1